MWLYGGASTLCVKRITAHMHACSPYMFVYVFTCVGCQACLIYRARITRAGCAYSGIASSRSTSSFASACCAW
jgi:hypothetical protein